MPGAVWCQVQYNQQRLRDKQKLFEIKFLSLSSAQLELSVQCLVLTFNFFGFGFVFCLAKIGCHYMSMQSLEHICLSSFVVFSVESLLRCLVGLNFNIVIAQLWMSQSINHFFACADACFREYLVFKFNIRSEDESHVVYIWHKRKIVASLSTSHLKELECRLPVTLANKYTLLMFTLL